MAAMCGPGAEHGDGPGPGAEDGETPFEAPPCSEGEASGLPLYDDGPEECERHTSAPALDLTDAAISQELVPPHEPNSACGGGLGRVGRAGAGAGGCGWVRRRQLPAAPPAKAGAGS